MSRVPYTNPGFDVDLPTLGQTGIAMVQTSLYTTFGTPALVRNDYPVAVARWDIGEMTEGNVENVLGRLTALCDSMGYGRFDWSMDGAGHLYVRTVVATETKDQITTKAAKRKSGGQTTKVGGAKLPATKGA